MPCGAAHRYHRVRPQHRLIERPERKRRWSTEGWDALQSAALRGWPLDRIEAPAIWGGEPTPLSIGELADMVRHDDEFRSVLDIWAGTDHHDLTRTLAGLLADEHMPYLSAPRYKPSGLRAEWEQTWASQRREDAGEKVKIPLPSTYASADFVKPSYWRNRGKLDMPKERFMSHGALKRDGDATELLGWAGWDHLAQAKALAAIYLDRRTNAGWGTDRLLPALAGLVELEPWLHQWHPGAAGFLTDFADSELAAQGADRRTLDTVRGVQALG